MASDPQALAQLLLQRQPQPEQPMLLAQAELPDKATRIDNLISDASGNQRVAPVAAPMAAPAVGVGGVGSTANNGVQNPFYGWKPSQISTYMNLVSAGVSPAAARARVGR